MLIVSIFFFFVMPYLQTVGHLLLLCTDAEQLSYGPEETQQQQQQHMTAEPYNTSAGFVLPKPEPSSVI